MRYALLIHEDEATWAGLSEEDVRRISKEYDEFTDDLVARGLMRGGEQFQSASSATTVRVEDGEILTADEPFPGTRGLGGFYVIEAEDLDQALDVAGRVPSTRVRATVEVRPIAEQSQR